MGSMVTRHGLHRHAYAPMPRPAFVTMHALTANVPGPRGAPSSLYPVTGPLATFAADGAPYYNTGYQPGYAAQVGGGQVPFLLPPRAAQLDLTDRESWDRPVFWPGSF